MRTARMILAVGLTASICCSQSLVRIESGTASSMEEGWTLARGGDMSGDGVTEVLVGCPESVSGAGVVRVLSGADGSLVRVLSGAAAGHQFGSAIDGGRDVDGDSVPDLIVGAPRWDPVTPWNARGKAYVFSGSNGALIHSVPGTTTSGFLGGAVALLGDLNGDGRSEFAVGAHGHNNLTGRVTIHDGLTGLVTKTLDGVSAGDRFGSSLAGIADMNGDGVADLLVGAPFLGSNNGAGRVYVCSPVGAPTTPPGFLFRDGAQGGEHLGWSVAAAGDLDGDGTPDFVAGAPDFDAGALVDAGRAVAFSGNATAPLWDLSGPHVYMKAGLDVDRVEDLDADGTPDVLVGMPYMPP